MHVRAGGVGALHLSLGPGGAAAPRDTRRPGVNTMCYVLFVACTSQVEMSLER